MEWWLDLLRVYHISPDNEVVNISVHDPKEPLPDFDFEGNKLVKEADFENFKSGLKPSRFWGNYEAADRTDLPKQSSDEVI